MWGHPQFSFYSVFLACVVHVCFFFKVNILMHVFLRYAYAVTDISFSKVDTWINKKDEWK